MLYLYNPDFLLIHCKADVVFYVAMCFIVFSVWHGIIFVRQGPFAGGAFRFEMVISDSFPQDAPLVKFVSKLFHPQVQSNG